MRTGVPPLASLAVHASLLSALLYLGARDRADYLAADTNLSEVTITPTDPAAREAMALDDPKPPTAASTGATPLDAPEPDAPDRPEPTPIDLRGVSTTLESINAAGALAGSSAPSTSALIAQSRPGAARPAAAASFVGLRSQAASRIVYVVDGSGAVVSTFRFLQEKLRQSIDRLAPAQRFDVVFFHDVVNSDDDPYDALSGDKLVAATPRNQHSAAEWIDTIRPAGRSDPLDGLRPALALKPDLVFLLSTSIPRTNAEWGAGRDAILAELDKLNPVDPRTGKRPVVIKTIQFLHDDPSGLMRDIARLHGDGEGSYRMVRFEELDEPDDPAETALDIADPSTELVINATAARLEAAERDGSVLAVLFGVPLPEQKSEAEGAAREALSLLERFDESDSNDVRVAMLRARAALVLASLEPREQTRAALARTALLNTQGRPLTEARADQARRVTHALALSMLGEPDAATQEITGVLRDLAEDASPADQVAEPLLALARVASGMQDRRAAAVALERLSARDPVASDALWQIVIAGARSRLAMQDSPPDPRALDPVLGLLDRPKILRDENQRRSLVYHTVAALTDPVADTLDWSRLPPLAAFARAVVVGNTAGGRDEALRLLANVANRKDAAPLGADALWEAAVLRRLDNTEQAQRDASAMLARLAREYPDSPHAADALAASINEARASDGDLPESFQLDLIRRAIDRFPDRPEIDIWRIDYAKRVAGLDRLDALEPIAPGTRQATLAAEMYFPAVRSLMNGANPADRLRLLRRAVAFAERHRRPEWAALAAELAESELDHDPAIAAKLASTLLGSDKAMAHVPSGRDHMTLVLAEARLALHDQPGAFELAKSIAEKLEPAADRNRDFWHAWAIMLEILADRDDADAHARATAHLARLRLLDPDLGGPPFSTRLQRVRDKLHSTT